MDFETFKNSLSYTYPPAVASVYLQSLWHDAKGNWDAAHTLIQDLPYKNASWIHAYLHRKEDDIFNANYWYRKANKIMPDNSLEAEWQQLVKAFLN